MNYPVRFKSGRSQLSGIFHRPPRVRKRIPAILFLHGFGGNRIGHHRFYVNMARLLERNGFAGLRFDFAGCGESEGDFAKTSLSSQLSDTGKALRFLGGRPEVDKNAIGVIGSSIGGTIALMLAGQTSRIKSLVLWAAVARTDEIVRANLDDRARRTLRKIGRLDIGGEHIEKGFFDEALSLNVLKSLSTARCKLCVIHGTEDQTVAPSESTLIYQRAMRNGLEAERHFIKGADHTFSRADWREELYSKTLAWFKRTLGNKQVRI